MAGHRQPLAVDPHQSWIRGSRKALISGIHANEPRKSQPRAGCVRGSGARVGENGSGKSTLLEAITESLGSTWRLLQ